MKINLHSIKHLLQTLLLCCLVIPTISQTKGLEESLLKQKAAAYTFAGKFDSAFYFGKQLVSKFPNTNNYLLLGSIYEIKKEPTNADIYYEKAIKSSDKNTFHVYSDLAYVAHRRGELSKMFTYTHRSLELDLDQPELHYFIGSIYDSLGQSDSANYHFTKAYSLDSNNTEYLKKMYTIYYKKGFVRESLFFLERVTQLDTLDHKSKITLANGFAEVEDYKKAIFFLNYPISKNWANDSDYYALSKCYLNLGDTINGIISLEKAISLLIIPKIIYYDELIHIYASLGQYGKMLEIFQEGARKGIYSFQQWMDSYKEKVDTMSHIYLNLEQGNPATHLFDLGKLYFAINDYQNCLKVLNDYQLIGGMQTDTLFALISSCNFNLNRNSEAKNYIEKAINLSPLNEDYKLLLLLILYKLKNYQEVINISRNFSVKNRELTIQKNEMDNYLLFKSYNALGLSKEAAVYHKAFQEQNNNR